LIWLENLVGKPGDEEKLNAAMEAAWQEAQRGAKQELEQMAARGAEFALKPKEHGLDRTIAVLLVLLSILIVFVVIIS
jgi:hypothetical protein